MWRSLEWIKLRTLRLVGTLTTTTAHMAFVNNIKSHKKKAILYLKRWTRTRSNKNYQHRIVPFTKIDPSHVTFLSFSEGSIPEQWACTNFWSLCFGHFISPDEFIAPVKKIIQWLINNWNDHLIIEIDKYTIKMRGKWPINYW